MAKTESQLPLQFDLFSLNAVKTETESDLLLQLPSSSSSTPQTTRRRASPLGDGESRSIALTDGILEYSLRRSHRRTIGLLIDSDGLRITAPKRSAIKTIEDAIRQKQQWIRSKLKQQQKAKEVQHTPVQWQNGARFPYLGTDLAVRLCSHNKQSILFNPGTSELILYLNRPATPQQIGEHIKKWIQQQARDIFSERLMIYAENLKVDYQSLSLSSATQRWGTCTAQGGIRLNWRLIHLPLRLIDYVIAHELAHRHEMNHSQRFWDIVASVYPNYALARKELHQQAPRILSIF